jgi:hypothetical protein
MTQTPAGTGFVSWVLTQTLLAVCKLFEMNLAVEPLERRLHTKQYFSRSLFS